MRNLTSKQIDILDKFIESRKERCKYLESPFTENRYGLSIEDLPPIIFVELEKINDTEVLYQNTNRYLMDQSFKITKNNQK